MQIQKGITVLLKIALLASASMISVTGRGTCSTKSFSSRETHFIRELIRKVRSPASGMDIRKKSMAKTNALKSMAAALEQRIMLNQKC